MDSVPSSQWITLKIVGMLILILADIIINSFVEASFSNSFQGKQHITNFYFMPIQIVSTGLIFVMMLIMMWPIFPLRYGLAGAIFAQFKWTFLVVFSFIAITVAERGLKLKQAISLQSNFRQISMWSDNSYVFLYYLRFLMYPIFYGFVINFCIKMIDPTFYRPNRWLK